MEGDYFEVDGKPFAMPARVLDASREAMFFVSTEAANRALGAATTSAFDAGGGDPLAIMEGLSQQRWHLSEFVVALTVAEGDPARQFTAAWRLSSHRNYQEAARRRGWRRLSPARGPLAADNVRSVSNGRGKALSIRFPRFGNGQSSDCLHSPFPSVVKV
jgi:hypothetical protein